MLQRPDVTGARILRTRCLRYEGRPADMRPNSETQSHPGRVFRLSYASRATRPMHRRAASQLAINAAASNNRDGVTGVLFSDHGLFLQWLEGPAPEVCAVMSRIAADPRHTDVTLLSAGWIADRRYSDWSMQLAEQPLPGATAGGRLRNRSKAPCEIWQALAAFEAAAPRALPEWELRIAEVVCGATHRTQPERIASATRRCCDQPASTRAIRRGCMPRVSSRLA